MFRIVEVPENAASMYEQLGSKFKYWYKHDGDSYLYKEGRPGTGENWAEKIACELCRLLDIPHSEYEFATWKGRKGVICKNFVPRGGRLIHANELLAEICHSYPTTQFYGVKQHTIRRLFAILNSDSIETPIDWQPFPGIQNALDVFIGYLLLDALISNQDRHHENWGLVYMAGAGKSYLAPTYDHASSLGRNESDRRRKEILTSEDNRRNTEHYVSRAVSTFYDRKQQNRLTTLEAFVAAGTKKPVAMGAWLNKLRSVTKAQMIGIIDKVPRTELTDIAAEFSLKMLLTNQRRLLSL